MDTDRKIQVYALKCRNFYISTVYAKQPGGTRLHFAVASLIPVKLYLLHVPLPNKVDNFDTIGIETIRLILFIKMLMVQGFSAL